MCRVSVVVPAYNAERTITDTLASVVAQTFKDIEVIVIDDGSVDGTARVAREAGDERVRVISTRNGGVAAARNRGIAEAKGEFVALLDADDLWLPTKLERQVALLESRPSVGMCFTAAERVDINTRPVGRIPAREYRDYCEALLLYSVVVSAGASSAMIRRTLALEIDGFDTSFSQSADWDFWLRLSRVTRFAAIPDVLMSYRSSPGNMSSDAELLERDTFAVLDKFFANPTSVRYQFLRTRSYSNHWMICAGSYLHAGQIGASLRSLRYGLRAYPANSWRLLGVPWRWIRRLAIALAHLVRTKRAVALR